MVSECVGLGLNSQVWSSDNGDVYTKYAALKRPQVGAAFSDI